MGDDVIGTRPLPVSSSALSSSSSEGNNAIDNSGLNQEQTLPSASVAPSSSPSYSNNKKQNKKEKIYKNRLRPHDNKNNNNYDYPEDYWSPYGKTSSSTTPTSNDPATRRRRSRSSSSSMFSASPSLYIGNFERYDDGAYNDYYYDDDDANNDYYYDDDVLDINDFGSITVRRWDVPNYQRYNRRGPRGV